MERIAIKAITEQMYQTCREIMPVTRSMNETDLVLVSECFEKFGPLFQKTSRRLASLRAQSRNKREREQS